MGQSQVKDGLRLCQFICHIDHAEIIRIGYMVINRGTNPLTEELHHFVLCLGTLTGKIG